MIEPHEVKVLVTLQVEEVDENDPVVVDDMDGAATEAVENAVRAAENTGFTHCLADKLCIGFVDAFLFEQEKP